MTALFYVSFFLVCKTLFICLFINPTLSDPRATEAALICTNRTAPFSQLPIFIANFVAAMEIVTPLVATQRFADVSNGTGNLTVYAYGECMKDLSRNDCNVCLAQCKAQILRCLPYQRGILGGQLFFDGCYLRYDDYYFSEEAISSEDKTVCGNTSFSGNQSVFKANTVELVRNLSVQAPENDGFYVGSVNRGNVSVYGLAQCWELVNGSSCKECLAKSVRMIGNCPPKDEGRVLNAGCYLRYSTQKFFYNSTVQRLPGGNAGRRLVIILAATSSALALIMIAATAAFFFNKKVLKKKRERRQLGGLLDTVNKSKLNFSYDTLEVATKYFHQSNKLGQGGCGSVYKGVLPDGRAVAVKRLFFNSKQWVDHFFNEVNLISGIHHNNLVKLLGCSIAGPESLLVYEYVPNRSLNDHFFGKNKSQQLSWDVRFKIVLGTARGLAYLHEESNLRIIHRDIKLSNVLLDQDYTAKIADFGLARLFPEDNTHISTGIAGTLGYMAPEYAICGKLTTKADVYSFGVLVIEILCGKKSISFSQNSFSILHTVWQLYGSGRLCEAIDPALDKCFDEEEACRLLQIGLLCVQASAELRPSMSSVVEMLTNNQNIPQPTQPPFLNNNSAQCSQSVSPQIYDSSPDLYHQYSENTMTKSLMQPR